MQQRQSHGDCRRHRKPHPLVRNQRQRPHRAGARGNRAQAHAANDDDDVDFPGPKPVSHLISWAKRPVRDYRVRGRQRRPRGAQWHAADDYHGGGACSPQSHRPRSASGCCKCGCGRDQLPARFGDQRGVSALLATAVASSSSAPALALCAVVHRAARDTDHSNATDRARPAREHLQVEVRAEQGQDGGWNVVGKTLIYE
jgi:hypothetical protein